MAELTALQSVLSQLPAGQAMVNGHMQQPVNSAGLAGAALPTASPLYKPGLLTAAPFSGYSSAVSTPAHGVATQSLLDASMATNGAALSNINPLILSALGALGGAGALASTTAALLSSTARGFGDAPVAQTMRPDGVSNGVGQLSGAPSLPGLAPLSLLASSSAPLSAEDLLQLLQHAHPSNRDSRISAIREEQRMLDEEDDDCEDEDDFDDSPHTANDAAHFARTDLQPALQQQDWVLPSSAGGRPPGLRQHHADGSAVDRARGRLERPRLAGFRRGALRDGHCRSGGPGQLQQDVTGRHTKCESPSTRTGVRVTRCAT